MTVAMTVAMAAIMTPTTRTMAAGANRAAGEARG
jgi:hypothetical protein